ncbi:MAG: response regulator transcription factor, partial [Candidatus Dormibacteraeota bacterium]|nr:response regulator transcription factor [Candidatus Dormibacteraeota bacterium]
PGDAPAARLRLRRAANYHRLGGAGQQAEGLLRQLLGEVPSGLERAAVLFALASTRQDDTRGMIRLCNEALEEAPEGDALVARILALRSWSRFLEGDLLASLADARSALEKAEQAGDEAMIAVAIARVGHAEAYVGEITRGLLERGAAIESRLGLSLESTESPRAMLARTWVRLGQVEAPRAAFVELEALAAARGDEASRAEMLWGLSMVEWAAGRLLVGLEHATETVETAEQIQDTHVRAAAARVKALIEADLGLVERSRASAEGSLALAQTMSDKSIAAFVQGVLGRLELELGNVEAAARYLRELPLRQLAVGFTDPTVPVWSDSIEALIAVGELDQARAYLEHYELQAERLGSPWAAAGAMRCRGLLASAEGDLAAAFTAFERSLSELDRISRPLDRGRALLGLGSMHRQARQKRAARDALELAVEIFEGLGARLWADRALAELRRISGRRRASEALTETEERVAWLAADGRSNKEIAAELYMSLHTVGAHLSRTYRKLEIRSRSELTARMRGVAAQHANEGHPSTKPAKEAPKT